MSAADDYDPQPCPAEDHLWACALADDDELLSYCRICGLVN